MRASLLDRTALLVALLLAGCGDAGPPRVRTVLYRDFQVGGVTNREGTLLSGPIVDGASSPEQMSFRPHVIESMRLWTWPERELVETELELYPYPANAEGLIPDMVAFRVPHPLEPHWYLVTVDVPYDYSMPYRSPGLVTGESQTGFRVFPYALPLSQAGLEQDREAQVSSYWFNFPAVFEAHAPPELAPNDVVRVYANGQRVACEATVQGPNSTEGRVYLNGHCPYMPDGTRARVEVDERVMVARLEIPFRLLRDGRLSQDFSFEGVVENGRLLASPRFSPPPRGDIEVDEDFYAETIEWYIREVAPAQLRAQEARP